MLSGQILSLSQEAPIDSLKHEFESTSNDTLKLVLVNQLRYFYFFEKGNLDSALVYSKQLLPLTQKLNYKIDEAYAMDLIADIMNYQNNQKTLETFFKGVEIAENRGSENNILPLKYLKMMIYWHPNFTSLLAKNNWSPGYFRRAILASLYQDLGHAYGKIMPNQQKLLFYMSKAIELYKLQKDTFGIGLSYVNIAEYFNSTDQLDSSLSYAEKAYDMYKAYTGKHQGDENMALSLIGTIHFKKGYYPPAINELRQSIQMGLIYQQAENWLAYFTLSEYFFKIGANDSSLYYAHKTYDITRQINLPEEMQKASAMLARVYEKKGINDSALKYFGVSLALSDSINNADKKRKLQSQDFEEQVHQQELQNEKAKVKLYSLLGGLAILLIVAFFLFKNNLQRKKINRILQKKNREIEKTLNDLKSTQAQLIQSAKMASLGELTAGIAHEIQNPLNFVNNFSEVNKELLSEMKSEMDNGNLDDAKAIANDVIANEEKINHHGKRADAIVKGMLQHSQASTGKKEPTDINTLADEYLRLSYHGFRAKDKEFNATMKTDFDKNIEKIKIIPQDIGRVLLNLYNNAFYAVKEKSKQQNENYEPTVRIVTKKIADKILITVSDNGNGIPQKVLDKIFQPFFTTKPTGQGTGLGLSLSYDIIKAHGGEIKVETKEGEGSEFIIIIPE